MYVHKSALLCSWLLINIKHAYFSEIHIFLKGIQLLAFSLLNLNADCWHTGTRLSIFTVLKIERKLKPLRSRVRLSPVEF